MKTIIAKFQSLIGELKTPDIENIYDIYLTFQSLIGELKTKKHKKPV